MNPIFQRLLETRSEVIFRHTRKMLRERRITEETFAMWVVEIFHARTPEDARAILFKTAGDPFACATANAQKLFRYEEAGINSRLPDDLEESWVFALEQPYRQQCLDDLNGRYGCLAVPMPDENSALDLQSISRLTGNYASVLGSYAPVMVDGKIDDDDRPHFPGLIKDLRMLCAQGEGMILQLEQALRSGHPHLP